MSLWEYLWIKPHHYGKLYEPDLDRIVNDEGYIKGNEQWAIKFINAKKSDLDLATFKDEVINELYLLEQLFEKLNDMGIGYK
ncbi:hypothetical protein LG291_23310 [Cytobacillus firmus]|uniref:hypothetical protein n=1 Tax=Cytobacillus firmus TaxID=1399 RepID=UPI00384BAAFB